MIEMIILFFYSKNNQKKSIDSVTIFCDSVRVLAADALRISFCGLIHNSLFD